MKFFITGAAGFIGMHVCLRLLSRGEIVVGIDNLNEYYDLSLKEARLARLKQYPNFYFFCIDIANQTEVGHIFELHKPEFVINLAAQVGVRYSISNPSAYVDSNLVGFLNILEGCRHAQVRHLVYASSSSVYGKNTKTPFSETDSADQPASLCAATKKANELMAYSYSSLYKISATGLRFSTIYGPWGRPDMAYFIFTKAILEGEPINVFNHGQLQRDFTYIDDIVEGVVRVIDKLASQDDVKSHRIFNIGNHNPITLKTFIECLEKVLGREAIKVFLPMQLGDMHTTYADTFKFQEWTDFTPNTPLQEGVEKFVTWYQSIYA